MSTTPNLRATLKLSEFAPNGFKAFGHVVATSKLWPRFLDASFRQAFGADRSCSGFASPFLGAKGRSRSQLVFAAVRNTKSLFLLSHRNFGSSATLNLLRLRRGGKSENGKCGRCAWPHRSLEVMPSFCSVGKPKESLHFLTLFCQGHCRKVVRERKRSSALCRSLKPRKFVGGLHTPLERLETKGSPNSYWTRFLKLAWQVVWCACCSIGLLLRLLRPGLSQRRKLWWSLEQSLQAAEWSSQRTVGAALRKLRP